MHIEISEDIVDKLLKKRLFEDHTSVCKDIIELSKLNDLKDYQKEDLKYNRKLSKAIRRVLQYYTTTDEYNDLLGERK